ncbi:putative deoxyribonuclease TATDN3 isoform X1 [Hydra vulgaris]|uniref:Putative deoxyribonuclease TATDN3 n=1 Tax=Hydra vulgaris TaxID=6087 RepID=T2MCN1_HYDVU|nr:putative deoxyribonuclease TATDN3 isoform X1 [Hydra vulgaris]
MIDVHCHISASEFSEDFNDLINEAKKVGVEAIVAVSEFPSDFQKVIKLSELYPNFIYPCIGVHPVQVSNQSVSLEAMQIAEKFIQDYNKILVGIGEIGLDFTPRYINSPTDKAVQRDVFQKQVALAKEYDLPINVHSRSAGRPVIDLLIEQGATKVLLHAFDGKISVAIRGVEAGYYFSVPPCIVRSEQKQKLVAAIPLSNLLLETDAPALGPSITMRNVPANIMISCREVARIKNISFEEVFFQTSQNARKLFDKIK